MHADDDIDFEWRFHSASDTATALPQYPWVLLWDGVRLNMKTYTQGAENALK